MLVLPHFDVVVSRPGFPPGPTTYLSILPLEPQLFSFSSTTSQTCSLRCNQSINEFTLPNIIDSNQTISKCAIRLGMLSSSQTMKARPLNKNLRPAARSFKIQVRISTSFIPIVGSMELIYPLESHMYGPSLLPTVTSFIPGLPEGAPFRISIHTWVKPEFSRYIRSIQKPGEILVYETRLYIDGKLVTSKWYDEHGPWPSILNLADGKRPPLFTLLSLFHAV